MIVTYKPEGSEPTVYTFRPRAVKASVAEMIEKRYGAKFEEWATDVVQGSAKARRVLLWHLTTTVHPHFKYEDTPDFAYGELVVERELEETRELRDNLAKLKGIDEDTRADALAAIDEEIAEKVAAGEPDPTEAS